jgi:hypothetical protein
LAVTEEQQEPLAVFLYALKDPETKRQYPRRFKVFLDFLKLEGTFEEQAKQFLVKARTNHQWPQDNFMQFIAFQIGIARRKEIAESTVQIIIKSYNRSIRQKLQNKHQSIKSHCPTFQLRKIMTEK